MKRKNIVSLIAIIAIVAAVIFAGCVEEESDVSVSTPTPTSEEEFVVEPEPTPTLESTSEEESPTIINAKPLMSFIIKKGDNRTVTVTCSDCGTTFNHNYTLGNKYICPECKTVIKAQTNIAVIKDGVVFAPLDSIINNLEPFGLKTAQTQTIDAKPVDGQRWRGTSIVTHYFQNDNVSMMWSEGSNNLIEVNGQVRELTSEPFKEKTKYVAYYGDGPRYKSTIDVSTGVGGGVMSCTITFVPLKDFVEPLGYEVKQTDNIVTVFSNEG